MIFAPLEPVVGEVVTFTASATGTLPIDFTWDFADGLPLTGSEVTYVFETPGPHFVGLMAKNACSLETINYAVPVEAVEQRILLPLVGR
jgi:PKD domain